jgi:Fe-S cluster assembly protein SufD
VPDSTTVAAAEPVGAFTRDQVEILSTRRAEPEWLRDARLRAHDAFAAAPMPTIREEEWRYTDLRDHLRMEGMEPAEERAPVSTTGDLPEGLRALMDDAGKSAARLVQVDGSVVYRELPEELRARGVILTSLDQAVHDHPELVQKYLGSAVSPADGKFAAQNAAFWTGGTFLYVPRDVRVELPVRAFRWLDGAGTTLVGRTLVVAGAFAEVSLVDELASEPVSGQSLSNGALEIFADEGARVHYVALQRWGSGVVHLTTDRLVAGRDARITTLYTTLGSDLTRADVRCRLDKPGGHVDMLGLYIGDGKQHFDHETLQDHVAPHASSNLLFKGAIGDRARSVFRGLIRVHKGAQRTDAYQTNRNLILSDQARADSLPNLEIGADDVRCSHAATVGQLDQEELFYLMSRAIPRAEAVRLVIFGFFGEVLEQLKLPEVRGELVRAIEGKLYQRKS